MNIEYRTGDLLKAAKNQQFDAMAHCCNCFCTMGSGIAPLLKKAWPEVYHADLQTKKGDRNKLGTFSKAHLKDLDVLVYNLYGQYGYSKRNEGLRDLNYDALFDALDKMAQDVLAEGGEVVGFPLIGCGLAGGSWIVVEAMIKQTFCERGLKVIIYKLN